MGSVIQGPELSLQCRPTYIPPTITDFLGRVSMIGNVPERLMKLDEYITRLEDELRKIDAFKRELPLCMLLLHDAILAVKEEAKRCRKSSNAEPVLEEFIPLKKSCDEEDNNKVDLGKPDTTREKMNWLSSVQLWNTSSDHQFSKPEVEKGPKEEANRVVSSDPFNSCKSRTVGIALMPFKGYGSFPVTAVRRDEEEELPGLPGLSLQTPGFGNVRDVSGDFRTRISCCRTGSASVADSQMSFSSGSKSQHQQSGRKQRRCWSPELHRRFVEALEQLGGTQVATPKQIRELMQVDGLTNDEVKSHLQKYRLHTRRTPAATAAPTMNHSGALLGSLWSSKDHEYSESSKQSNSQSGSPQGPLQFDGTSRGTSTTGGDSMEDEDEERSDSHSWKNHVHSYEENHV